MGTALLSTLFASSAATFARAHPTEHGLRAAAMIHGYTTAFWWASGIFALGLAVAIVVFPARVNPAQATANVNSEVSLATE